MRLSIAQGLCLCLTAIIVGYGYCDTSHDIGILSSDSKEETRASNTTAPSRSTKHLVIFSFTFSKRNLTRNGTRDGGYPRSPGMDVAPFDGMEKSSSLYDEKRLRISWLNRIPMRFLYLIASSSLLLLFLMIIKLIVSRRGKGDYSLVTKGDFDA